jgi:hypothetical protein
MNRAWVLAKSLTGVGGPTVGCAGVSPVSCVVSVRPVQGFLLVYVGRSPSGSSSRSLAKRAGLRL